MSYYLLYYDYNKLEWVILNNKFVITNNHVDNITNGQFISSLWYNSILDMYKNTNYVIIKLKDGYGLNNIKEIFIDINKYTTEPYSTYFNQISIIKSYKKFVFNVIEKRKTFNKIVMSNDIKRLNQTFKAINDEDIELSLNIKVVNKYTNKEFNKNKQINNIDIRNVYSLYATHPSFKIKN